MEIEYVERRLLKSRETREIINVLCPEAIRGGINILGRTTGFTDISGPGPTWHTGGALVLQ